MYEPFVYQNHLHSIIIRFIRSIVILQIPFHISILLQKIIFIREWNKHIKLETILRAGTRRNFEFVYDRFAQCIQ